MSDGIQAMLDKQAIYETLVRYCRGVDRCDETLVRSVYHDDAHDDHGYWRGSGSEFATFVCRRLSSTNSATTHSITNVLIELDGDKAVSESQVVATLIRRDTDPIEADIMGARYHDRLSKRGGEWRIDSRTVVLDWHKTEQWASTSAPVPLEGFSRGARHPDDPVYALTAGRAEG